MSSSIVGRQLSGGGGDGDVGKKCELMKNTTVAMLHDVAQEVAVLEELMDEWCGVVCVWRWQSARAEQNNNTSAPATHSNNNTRPPRRDYGEAAETPCA
jgi:hypothetical protein